MTRDQRVVMLLRGAAKIQEKSNVGMCSAVYFFAHKQFRTKGEFWEDELESAICYLAIFYRPDSTFQDSAFWMGPLDRRERRWHRVVALLMLADVIEAGDW